MNEIKEIYPLKFCNYADETWHRNFHYTLFKNHRDQDAICNNWPNVNKAEQEFYLLIGRFHRTKYKNENSLTKKHFNEKAIRRMIHCTSLFIFGWQRSLLVNCQLSIIETILCGNYTQFRPCKNWGHKTGLRQRGKRIAKLTYNSGGGATALGDLAIWSSSSSISRSSKWSMSWSKYASISKWLFGLNSPPWTDIIKPTTRQFWHKEFSAAYLLLV